MRKLVLLALSLCAVSSKGQTTNTYQTKDAVCTITSDLQLNCPLIEIAPSGTLNLAISSYDAKAATFTAGLATWTLASDDSNQVSCSGLNGGWDYPRVKQDDLKYPTVVVGYCSGNDSNGKDYTLSLVEFVTVYRDGSQNQWVAKIRNGTLTITQ